MKKLMVRQLTRSLSALCSCVMIMVTVLASADTYKWSTETTGAAVDGAGTWNTATANWVGAGDVHSNWNNANGDTAAFGNGGTAGTVTLSSGITIGGLLFNPGITGAYTLAGGPLNLVNTPTFDVGANATVSTVIQGAPGFTKTGNGTLTLSAANTFTGDVVVAAGTLRDTLQVNLAAPVATGLGNMTLVGRQIQVNGGATLLFANNDPIGSAIVLQNTSFVIDGGTVDHGTFFVTMPNLLLKNGATLTGGNGVNGNYQTFNLMGSVTVAGTPGSTIATVGSSLTGVHLGNGNNSFIVHPTGSDPDLAVSVPLINKPGNLAASGFTKTGAGKMLLSADNSYSGGTTVSNGILQIGNGGATGTVGSGPVKLESAGTSLVFNRSGTVNVPGLVSGSGSLKQLGSGVVMLSGGNTYTGTTTVSNGILAVSGLLAGYDTPGMITVGPGAGLTVDPLKWNIGALASLLGNASFAPDSLFGAGTLSGDDEIPNSLALPNSMGFVKTGPNVLTLSGNNSYAGGTFVMGGILHADFGAGISATTNVTLNNGSFSPITGPLTAALGTGAGQVNIVPGSDSGFSAVGTPLTVNLGGAGAALSWGAAAFNPRVLVLNEIGANTNLTLVNGINLNAARTINVNATTASINGTIANGSATAGVVKGGAGTLELTAANTYTGGTTINAGTLKLTGGDNRLSTTGGITLNAGTTVDLDGNQQGITSGNFSMANGSTLAGGILNYKNESWQPSSTSSATFADRGGINSLHRLILFNGQTLTLAADAGASKFGGNGSSSANFIGVDNNNTNYLTVNGGSFNFTNMDDGAGYLRIGSNGNSGSNPRGTVTLNNGAISVGHSMNMGGRYDNNLNAATYGTATLNLNSGGLDIGTGTSTATGNGNRGWLYLGNNHSSTVSRSTINLNGGILTLVQLQAGVYGSNLINFNGGTLKARANNQSLINGNNLLCNLNAGGAVIDTDGFSVGINSTLSGVGGLIKRGSGTLTLSGTNTFSGKVQVEEGSLKLANPVGAPNLRLHLDASDVSTLAQNANGSGAVASGDPVGSWGDLSSSGLPATQANAGRRPTYVESSALFNNMPVLRFDGSDDDMTSLLDINASQIPDMTIVMVYRQVTYTLQRGLWGHDNGGWDRLQLLNWDNTIGKNLIAASNGTVAVNGMNTNGVVIYAATLKNGVVNGSSVHINGVANSSSGLPAFASQEGSGLASITLANISPGGGYRSNVEIGEVLVFDAALSDSVRGNVENQLRSKWLGAETQEIAPVLACRNEFLEAPQEGLKLRLDAADASTLFANSDGTGAVTNNGQVGYWGDLSDSAKPATQATPSRRPKYIASAADFNGMPVLEFDGSDDEIASLLNINPSQLPKMTIFIAFRQKTYKRSALWGHDDGEFDRFQLLNFNSVGDNQIAADNSVAAVKGMHTDKVMIYAAALDNGVASGSSVYINGVADASTGLSAFTSNDRGGQNSITFGNIGLEREFKSNVQIGEILIYNSVLTAAERAEVESYLHEKWVLPDLGVVNLASDAVLDLNHSEVTLTAVEGVGTVSNGTLSVTGSISPAGSSIGTLKIATAALGGTLLIDLAADGTSDLLSVTGDLALNGLTLQVKDTALLDQAKCYIIVSSSGALTGSFAATNLGSPWKVSYDRTAGTAAIRWIPDGTVILVR